MSAERRYRLSKVVLLSVLLLAFPAVRSGGAWADLPEPYYDCQGNQITPEQYDEMVSAFCYLDSIFWQGVFAAPFEACSETLMLTCEPSVTRMLTRENGARTIWVVTVQEVIPGERRINDTLVEEFSFEVLEYYPMGVEELCAIWGEQLDPELAQELATVNYVEGMLSGILYGPVGEVPLFGHLVTLDVEVEPGRPSERRSFLFPVREVGQQELDDAANGQAMLWWMLWFFLGDYRQPHIGLPPGDRMCVDGATPMDPCWLSYKRCMRNAVVKYQWALHNAHSTYLDCLSKAGALGLSFGAGCLKWLSPGGWVGAVGCGIIGGGTVILNASFCHDDYSSFKHAAYVELEANRLNCEDELLGCSSGSPPPESATASY